MANCKVTLKETETAPRTWRSADNSRVFERGKPQELPENEARALEGNPLFSVTRPPPAEKK